MLFLTLSVTLYTFELCSTLDTRVASISPRPAPVRLRLRAPAGLIRPARPSSRLQLPFRNCGHVSAPELPAAAAPTCHLITLKP